MVLKSRSQPYIIRQLRTIIYLPVKMNERTQSTFVTLGNIKRNTTQEINFIN